FCNAPATLMRRPSIPLCSHYPKAPCRLLPTSHNLLPLKCAFLWCHSSVLPCMHSHHSKTPFLRLPSFHCAPTTQACPWEYPCIFIVMDWYSSIVLHRF